MIPAAVCKGSRSSCAGDILRAMYVSATQPVVDEQGVFMLFR